MMRRFGNAATVGLFSKGRLAVGVVLLTVGMGGSSWAATDSMVDPDWKRYGRVSGVSGNLNSIGSDTLNNLMTLWAEGFRKEYPNVKIQIEGKGSSTAPPAPDRRNGANRADVEADESQGDGQVRGEIRL